MAATPLSPEQVESFNEQGFLQVDRLFPPVLCRTALDEGVSSHVTEACRALSARRKVVVEPSVLATPIEQRLAVAEALLPGVSTVVHKTAWADASVRRIWGHPNVVAAAGQLLSATLDAPSRVEVAAHPAFNLRCKAPSRTAGGADAVVPWHQDVAYVVSRPEVEALLLQQGSKGGYTHGLSSGASQTPQLTLWVPLVDMAELEAAEERTQDDREVSPRSSAGPLEAITCPFVNRRLLPHVCQEGQRGWYASIPEEALQGQRTEAPATTFRRVPLGGGVFFHSYTPHRALENTLHHTGGTRWSIDVRFQPAVNWSTRDGFPTGCETPALPFCASADGVQIAPAPDDDLRWGALPCARKPDWDAALRPASTVLEPAIGGPWMDVWPRCNVCRRATGATDDDVAEEQVVQNHHFASYDAGTVQFPQPRYNPQLFVSGGG